MTTTPYFKVPAHRIPLHPRSAEFGARMKATSWTIASQQTGWGFAVFDAREAAGRTEKVWSRMYRPRMNGGTAPWPRNWLQTLVAFGQGKADGVIPWSKAWDKLIPAGTDQMVEIINPETGQRWSLWQVRREFGRLIISHGGMVAKVTTTRLGDPTELRDAKGQLVPANTLLEDVNAPFSSGSGIVGYYLNDTELVRPVDVAMSMCFRPDTFGETIAVAPAAQQEPNNKQLNEPIANQMMVSGAHPAWSGVEAALRKHLPNVPPGERQRVENLCRGMSYEPTGIEERPGFGAYGTITGGNCQITLGFSTLSLRCITAIAADVEWRLLAPPNRYLAGRNLGPGTGWGDHFEWPTPA